MCLSAYQLEKHQKTFGGRASLKRSPWSPMSRKGWHGRGWKEKRWDGKWREGSGGEEGERDRESARNGADRGVEKGRKVGGEGRKGRSGQVLVMNRTAYRYIPFNLPTLPTAVQQMIGVSGPILQDSLNTKMGNTVVQTDT